MSFPSYTEYKNSGVAWLGTLPSHWQAMPLKWQLIENAGGVWGADPDGANNTKVLRSTDQTADGHWRISDPALRALSPKEKSSALLKTGDLVVTKSSGSSLHIGKTTLVTAEIEQSGFCYGNFMQRLRLKRSLLPKICWYLMNNDISRVQLDLLSNSTTGLANLNGTLLGELLIPVATIQEQTQIARFLDHETAKIDTLIHEQKRLIELLKEKRQAVISHAVTKGLDPDVPMKDSGVEWLGEVPAHWQLSKFGYLSNVVRGGSPRPAGDPSLFNGDYMPWVTVAEITKDESVFLDKTETSLTRLGSAQCRVFKAGTLLISNSGATLGVPKVLNIDANANDGVVGFESLNKTLCIKFAYHYLASLTENLRERIRQGSGQPNLNTEIIRGIVIPLPSPKEQKAIIDFIDAKSSKYSELCREGAATVRTLEERRSALISAAVTGKIDVRDWQPPADESAFDEQVRQAEMEAEA